MSVAARFPQWCWLLCATALLSGCAQYPVRVLENFSEPKAAHSFNGVAIDSGDIVISQPYGPLSLFFALYPREFQPYMHAGVLVIEDDRAYVYHAMGVIKPAFGGPPTRSVGGGIFRTPLDEFIYAQRYVEIFQPDPAIERARVVAFARAQYRNGTPFDPYFDSEDRRRLYCTEFVAAALEAGGAEPFPVRPNRVNPSLQMIKEWLGVRANGSIQASDLIIGYRHTATFSAEDSLTRTRLRIAAYREIYRRFTPDQKLGNVFQWDGTRLEFRDSVHEFLAAALVLSDDAANPSPDEIDAAVAALARKMFGAVQMQAANQH